MALITALTFAVTACFYSVYTIYVLLYHRVGHLWPQRWLYNQHGSVRLATELSW